MPQIMADEARALKTEQDELSRQQQEAILHAAYFRMSHEEADAFDVRHARIAEITTRLTERPEKP